MIAVQVCHILGRILSIDLALQVFAKTLLYGILSPGYIAGLITDIFLKPVHIGLM